MCDYSWGCEITGLYQCMYIVHAHIPLQVDPAGTGGLDNQAHNVAQAPTLQELQFIVEYNVPAGAAAAAALQSFSLSGQSASQSKILTVFKKEFIKEYQNL